jgi:ribonuclease P/MRP protein subunit POP5
VKYISPTTSTAIIRVSRSHYRLIWAALSFITKIPLPSPSFNNHNHHNNNKNSNNEQPRDRPCVVQVVRVSGTIKKAEEEAIRRARIVIARARRVEKRRRGGAAVGEGGFMEEDGEVGGIEDLGMDLDEDEDEDDESGE